MSKYKIDVSPLTREITIDGQAATADVTIALMIQMESMREKETGSDSCSYYIKGIGELTFTPEKNMTQERISYLLHEGTSVKFRVGY